MPAESTLLVLLLILSFGLIVPELFMRLKLPYVTSLILIGALLGPNGLGYVASNEIIEFFGFLGFTFLMLLAGLETDLRSLKQSKRPIMILALANGIVPFVLGFGTSLAFGYGPLPSLLVGTIFISSSVAIILPTIRSAGLANKPEGQIMAAAVFVEDVLSLFLLAIVFQTVAPITKLPLPLYFVVLGVSVLALWFLLPKVSAYFMRKTRLFHHEEHEDQTRLVIVLLIAVLVYFSSLGVHPIVAAFLVGALLSTVVTSHLIVEKIHTLGYGLFVPVFFFIVGMEMDVSVFLRFDAANLFILAIIAASILGKTLSGYLAGRKIGFSKEHSAFFGVLSTPQLTTTLATTYAASNAGIIDGTLTTAVIALSIVTTVIAPIIIRFLTERTSITMRRRVQRETHRI